MSKRTSRHELVAEQEQPGVIGDRCWPAVTKGIAGAKVIAFDAKPAVSN